MAVGLNLTSQGAFLLEEHAGRGRAPSRSAALRETIRLPRASAPERDRTAPDAGQASAATKIHELPALVIQPTGRA